MISEYRVMYSIFPNEFISSEKKKDFGVLDFPGFADTRGI